MAPEALSSEVFPASDVWAAGVMAYQLLSGYLPFDDARNREAPALSQARAPRVWGSRPAKAASCHASLQRHAWDRFCKLLSAMRERRRCGRPS